MNFFKTLFWFGSTKSKQFDEVEEIESYAIVSTNPKFGNWKHNVVANHKIVHSDGNDLTKLSLEMPRGRWTIRLKEEFQNEKMLKHVSDCLLGMHG